jgi:hypothetical protein
MFVPRTIRSSLDWQDANGAKLYTISADGSQVDQQPFLARLAEVKSSRPIVWDETPHFAIFHKGASFPYLILSWWGNDNELFNSVSVRMAEGWVEQPDRYSFCLYDMEIFWDERNFYIDTIDCQHPNLSSYRNKRRKAWLEGASS